MPATLATPTILVVDDDVGLLILIEGALLAEKWRVATAASGAEALAWLQKHTADLLLLDLKLSDIEGRELIAKLNEVGHRIPFIIVTGQGDERVAVEMMKSGALDYLIKDIHFLEFVPTVVRRALARLADEKRLAEAEEALRETNEFSKQVINGAQAGIIVCDQEGRFVVWNPFMEQISGHSSAVIVGRQVEEALPSLHEQHFEKLFRQALTGEVFEAADIPFEHSKTGKRCWTTARFAPLRDARQLIIGVIVAVRDITERRRLEAELLEISDREQQRIGHDLHDGLGQQLTGLEMKNFLLMEDLAEADLTANREKLLEQARQISTRLRDCVTLTRALARGLAPVNVKAGGLIGALEGLAYNTRVPDKLECRFTCRASLTLDNSQIEGHLYRIAQEAVNNALKHARPKRIQLTLTHEQGQLRLQIKDDGRGLPARKKASAGMGLEIMRHRAHVIGATLEIESKTGHGVQVTCTLPLTES